MVEGVRQKEPLVEVALRQVALRGDFSMRGPKVVEERCLSTPAKGLTRRQNPAKAEDKQAGLQET
jgi:hypothetical protein